MPKTTIDLNSDLYRRAKRLAAAEGITLKELVEAGLKDQLERRESPDFTLPDRSFGGRGVHDGIDEGDWDTIARLIYTGRGG